MDSEFRVLTLVMGTSDSMRLNYEGTFFSSKDLRQVQNCSAARRGAGDLREPQAQAAARMIRAGVTRLDSSGVASKVGERGGLRWQELRA
jgi:hypothetical protein